MTAVADPEAQVQVADGEDVKAAISNALKRAGCSFDELAEQAKTGRYSSTRSRLAWMAIGDLYGVNL
jgi:predicted nucleotidyltransferase